MSLPRITQLFNHHKAYIGYLTAGDGGIKNTLQAALALIAGGVNMLEIGVPFSDPIADGPIIQRAATRSLHAGTTLKDILWLVQEIRQQSDIPLILFSYLNPILSRIKTDFLKNAKLAGIDGLLLVDCPIEESTLIQDACQANDIAPIYVVTPATSLIRLEKIAHAAKGFLYYACRKGTTGVKTDLPEDFAEKIQFIKSIVSLPVVVGFGISNQTQVTTVLNYADGVVVGSLFVQALEEGKLSTLTTLAQSLKPSLAYSDKTL